MIHPIINNKEELHTQGEWRYDGHGIIYVHSPREPIVEVRNYSNVSEQQANAELIIKAVNERAELIKQRDAAIKELNYMVKEDQKHREETKKAVNERKALKEENDKLKDRVKYLESLIKEYADKIISG